MGWAAAYRLQRSRKPARSLQDRRALCAHRARFWIRTIATFPPAQILKMPAAGRHISVAMTARKPHASLVRFSRDSCVGSILPAVAGFELPLRPERVSLGKTLLAILRRSDALCSRLTAEAGDQLHRPNRRRAKLREPPFNDRGAPNHAAPAAARIGYWDCRTRQCLAPCPDTVETL